MTLSSRTALIVTTALAIALSSFDLRPAQAAPEHGPAIAKQNSADDFSAARKRRRARRVNPAIPLAAFGAIIGTIGSIAAEQRRRDYYESQYRYYGGGPYYYGYGGGPYYYGGGQPYYRGHVYRQHRAPAYRQRVYPGHISGPGPAGPAGAPIPGKPQIDPAPPP